MTHTETVCNFEQLAVLWLPRLTSRQGSGMSQAQSGGAMSHLMKLAEALRDIAEECSKSEIEQALGLRMGFADRVSSEPEGPAEYHESLGRSIMITCSGVPN